MIKARLVSFPFIAICFTGCWAAADAGQEDAAAPHQGNANGGEGTSAGVGGANGGEGTSAGVGGANGGEGTSAGVGGASDSEGTNLAVGGETNADSRVPTVTLSLVPTKHRAESSVCPEERAPGSANVVGDCTQDSDCTDGLNGRCISPNVLGPLGRSSCSYDDCGSDADCAVNEPCRCRESADSDYANVCLAGSNCRVDSDCGPGGFCSPSRFDIDSSVYAVPVFGDGSLRSGYFCHTPGDYCVNDSDCDANDCLPEQGCGGMACIYTTEERWDCFKTGHR